MGYRLAPLHGSDSEDKHCESHALGHGQPVQSTVFFEPVKGAFHFEEWKKSLHSVQSHLVTEAIWSSFVRFAAFSKLPRSSISQISLAIFASMAAPMKNVCGLSFCFAKAS